MSVGQMTHMLGYVIQLTRDGRFFDAFKLLLQVIVSLAMQLFMYFTYLPSDFEKLRKGSGSAGGQGGHSHGGHGHSHGPSAPQQNIREHHLHRLPIDLPLNYRLSQQKTFSWRRPSATSQSVSLSSREVLP